VSDGADLGPHVDGGEVVGAIVANETLEGTNLLHFSILPRKLKLKYSNKIIYSGKNLVITFLNVKLVQIFIFVVLKHYFH
jgi:hypothetical protein